MLKRAVASDAAMVVVFELAVMDRKLYGKPLDHAAAEAEINTNDYYLNLSDGRLVATGALRRREDGSTYLSSIAVHPDMRRKGLARAMMCHLLSKCEDAPSVDLVVHPDNHAARALYGSLGFVPTETCENFFGDGEPRVIMERVRTTGSG
jgi:ribosomal protein S18 acetylase RimI-like enzyme